ncbi:ABC transporter permease [Quadrisphaera sp. KR29]|uniref:ABC transporter permease n=1 Tax=Quadrisphaera sp. KR29 TaxID=3461391 RepID=UPI0040450A6F
MATPPPEQSAVRRFFAAYLQPLVFVIGFPLAFASALHAPTPHDLPLAVVGPQAVVAQVADGLQASGAFATTHTDDPGAAEQAVRDRQADGAIRIDVQQPTSADAQPTFTVTTYVAGGGGLAAAGAVRQAGAQVAQQLGTTAQVIDVAPLSTGDGQGTGLFFLLTYTSLGGYLAIISLMQFLPSARLRSRYLAAGVTAIGAPVLVYGLSAIFVGTYGASFAATAALLGVASLYVFTVSAATILINQFLGRMATVGVMALIVMLNFPGSGGSIPAGMLPPFWQGLHSVYFGAGALEAFRSIIYFDGAGIGRWLLQLSAWTVGLVLITAVVHLRRTVRTQRDQLIALGASSPGVSRDETTSVSADGERVSVGDVLSSTHAPGGGQPEPSGRQVEDTAAAAGAPR